VFKPVELEIELFCRGMKIGDSCHVEQEARRIARTRAGLGSGLELIIPTSRKKIWMNVPIVERFTEMSPFTLEKRGPSYFVDDRRDGITYGVEIPEEPKWYSQTTSSGAEMSRIGVLQGNYLGIYVSNRCLYWNFAPSLACKFCTTGKNVGFNEEGRKKIDDVVEVAIAARDESGSVFTHMNTGYHYEDLDEKESMHGLKQCEPYVRAIRERVGGFIGVQAVPMPRHRWNDYDRLIEAGVDHFSFCYEFEDPEVFARLCPGKAKTHGQKAFFDAMEYTAKKLGPGRVSGEIIAGPEPLEATKRGIDRIVNAGAFPTVCIFRPTIGSDMENEAPPHPEAMKEIFAYMYDACRRVGLPVGILPIEVSLVVQPEETVDLVEQNFSTQLYQLKNWTLRQLAKPYIAWKLQPRPGRAGRSAA
jgi:hypothetical protein